MFWNIIFIGMFSLTLTQEEVNCPLNSQLYNQGRHAIDALEAQACPENFS